MDRATSRAFSAASGAKRGLRVNRAIAFEKRQRVELGFFERDTHNPLPATREPTHNPRFAPDMAEYARLVARSTHNPRSASPLTHNPFPATRGQWLLICHRSHELLVEHDKDTSSLPRHKSRAICSMRRMRWYTADFESGGSARSPSSFSVASGYVTRSRIIS